MGLTGIVPLTEAAAFTFGCAVLRTRRLDEQRVGAALATIAVALLLTLLVRLTPAGIAIDAQALDPAHVWPLLPTITSERSTANTGFEP